MPPVAPSHSRLEFVSALQAQTTDPTVRAVLRAFMETPLASWTHLTGFSTRPAPGEAVSLQLGSRPVTFPLTPAKMRALYVQGESFELEVFKGMSLEDEIVYAMGAELVLETSLEYLRRVQDSLTNTPFHTQSFFDVASTVRAHINRLRARYDGQVWVAGNHETLELLHNPLPSRSLIDVVGTFDGADLWAQAFLQDTLIVGIKTVVPERATGWYTCHGVTPVEPVEPPVPTSGTPGIVQRRGWKRYSNTHILDASAFGLITK